MFGGEGSRPLGKAEDDYALYATPSAVADPRAPGEAEIARRFEGRPAMPQEGYNDPQGPLEPAMDVSSAVGADLEGKDNIISVHGYMHKQGKRAIKGPMHKSWKRRYFGAYPCFPRTPLVRGIGRIGRKKASEWPKLTPQCSSAV